MSNDVISRQMVIEALFDWEMTYDWDDHCREEDPKPEYIVSPSDVIKNLPSAQPEKVCIAKITLSEEQIHEAVEKAKNELQQCLLSKKNDLIQKFHDYQVEWLTSHCDLELEPTLEEWVVRFLHDTANCFMMELERGEQK